MVEVTYEVTSENDKWIYSDCLYDGAFFCKSMTLKNLPTQSSGDRSPEAMNRRIWEWILDTERVIPGFFKKTAVEQKLLERYPDFYDAQD